MIVLDTNVLSELMGHRAPPVVEWLDDQDAADVATTAVTLAELLYGIVRLDAGARRAGLAAAMQRLVVDKLGGRVIPFDGAAAVQYGELVATRERRGRPIDVPDAQIAAICRVRAATLATRNVRDFEATGVAVINPWAAG
jgi:toxin FitB